MTNSVSPSPCPLPSRAREHYTLSPHDHRDLQIGYHSSSAAATSRPPTILRHQGVLTILAIVNKVELLSYLEQLDSALKSDATLHVYGSAALILLDEPDRTSLDIDVAAPYSLTDYADMARAALAAGLPINPAEDYAGDHIEWISALRLCLPSPSPETDLVLWRGSRLIVKTGAIPSLIASKLIRYDEIDRSDIQYLSKQSGVAWSAVAAAVELLPPPFNLDRIVLENLDNLKADMGIWSDDRS